MSEAPTASTFIAPSFGVMCSTSEARNALAVRSAQPSDNALCASVTASAKVGTARRSLSRSVTGSAPALASLRSAAAFSRASASVRDLRSIRGVSIRRLSSAANALRPAPSTSTAPRPMSRRLGLPSGPLPSCTLSIQLRAPDGATTSIRPAPSTRMRLVGVPSDAAPGLALRTSATVSLLIVSPLSSPHNMATCGECQ